MTLDRDRLAAIRATFDGHPDPNVALGLADLLAAAEEAVRLRDAVDRVTALTYASDDGSEFEHVPGCEGEDTCPACWAASIRQALDGIAALTDALGEGDR